MLNAQSYDAAYNKTGVLSPKYNPFTWSKHATLIALDSPPPIGFSYCSELGPSAGGTSCGPWTDKTVFAANHEAHKTLFNKIFPELKPNPFYFAGESYAGIYVPGFANAMMDDPIPGLNFKGFAVGDGCTGCDPGTPPFLSPSLSSTALREFVYYGRLKRHIPPYTLLWYSLQA
jgi:carboxypeptidase C (cathepsin A)